MQNWVELLTAPQCIEDWESLFLFLRFDECGCSHDPVCLLACGSRQARASLIRYEYAIPFRRGGHTTRTRNSKKRSSGTNFDMTQFPMICCRGVCFVTNQEPFRRKADSQYDVGGRLQPRFIPPRRLPSFELSVYKAFLNSNVPFLHQQLHLRTNEKQSVHTNSTQQSTNQKPRTQNTTAIMSDKNSMYTTFYQRLQDIISVPQGRTTS